ncbi:alpha/beta fold hydrolase [Nocardia bovistercoris]|uniref:Alpha/beta hydrolase n=1 Tax=Nocardia bovistercoris TaxID=2785916 RepID=A0A931ID36_9NOCA|nr:alpha/beta hydrolase [Nocardia bovistercoris]MBH0779457.1 alpha/beta hydrolase [Nocardia bovistercoris]
MVEHMVARAERARIALEIAGAGAPLVLVPGAGGRRDGWDPLWQSLTASNRCVRYDLRGCGASESVADASFRHADDLRAVLDTVAAPRAAIIGVSMGARIAVDFALEHPDRVERLVLISPGIADWDWTPRWRQLWDDLVTTTRAGQLDRVRDMWFRHPLFATARRDPALAARLRAQIAADTCHVWLHGDRERPPARPPIEHLHELAMPTLLLSGTEDLPDFRLIADIVAAAIPDLDRIDISDAGHLLHLERPHNVLSALENFLARP